MKDIEIISSSYEILYFIYRIMSNLYAILDIGDVGSIVHQVVLIDISDPNNITYIPFGTIAGFPDKYFVSATLDPLTNKLFFALSDSDSNTSVINIYLYTVTFPDLLIITPFCVINTIYINLNPQVTYNVANGLFYYAVNNDPLGYDYSVNTVDSSGNIIVTSINTTELQNSSNGLAIFNNYIYATYRPGNSFTVYYADISSNITGSITSPITPQPPGQIWSVFDLNGVLWGTTEYSGSSPPSYSLYKLQCTTAGIPATDPFPSEFVGDMPTTFGDNLITNMTLFTPSACIHGSSKVHLANGTQKAISKLSLRDIVICPKGKEAKIKQIVPCWNNLPGHLSQYMIVFEKDSICENTPSERFLIDPKHLMCTINEYLKDGNKALKCAREWVNNKTIYNDRIENIELEDNIRYDLVLENADVYIANNIVIRARQSFKYAGY
jgi:hypothetical protein